MDSSDMDMKIKAEKFRNIIDGYLEKLFIYDEHSGLPRVITDAMSYSALDGGKRMRPILLLGACDMLGGDIGAALPYAAAVELIHSYSLVHDDLPSMDDDDFRRGKPANHKKFGEAVAILAGDGLLNLAFETMLDNGSNIAAIRVIARAAGYRGMVGGQALEIISEGKPLSPEELLGIHRLKTGALIRASIVAGAHIAGAGEQTVEKLDSLGRMLGEAFQIMDDISDAEGESGGSNFAVLAGAERARECFDALRGDIDVLLGELGLKGGFFDGYISLILNMIEN